MTQSDQTNIPEGAYYMGMPVSELPEPYVPSVLMECNACGAEVWIDEKCRDIAERCVGVLCRPCLLERANDHALREMGLR